MAEGTLGEIEFIDNGDAPIMTADGLHDVDVIGNWCWFLLYQVRRTAGGVLYREPAFHVRLPCDAVGPGIALTIKKAGASIIIPAAFATVRDLTRGWLN